MTLKHKCLPLKLYHYVYIYGMVWYGIYGIYTLFILQKGQEQEQEGSINLMFT